MKLLIKDTTIVTVNDQDQVLENADLTVSGKNIVGVGKAPLDFIPDRVIDGKGKLVMPGLINACLLYTSPSPRDRTRSRMPSSA